MELEIIKLTEIKADDADKITLLAAQLGYVTSPQELTIRLSKIVASENDCVFIARSGKEVIGWIHAFVAIRVETPMFVEIAALVVDESFRKLQLGKRLIEAVTDWSNRFPIEKITIRCNVTRLETHRFYEHLGFSINKQQKVFEKNMR